MGNTPLLPLRSVTLGLSPRVRVFAKAEWFNPGGSVKDRPALNIIRTALANGDLGNGKRLLDSTSGNMGISYATFGAALGIPVTIVIPAKASPERMSILKALGANVLLTDPLDGSDGAILKARELALVMLGSALAFSAVFTGPWGWLKSAAYAIGSPAWIGYALGFLGLTIFLLPGLYVAAVWVGERLPGEGMKLRQGIIHHSRVLLPLGLAAWIAFTISFALPKINTVLSVLSDPFGWGWNLLGTTVSTWSPDVSGFSPLLQAIVLMVGLGWSASVGGRNGRGGSGQFAKAGPVLIFCLGFTLVMLWLLVG